MRRACLLSTLSERDSRAPFMGLIKSETRVTTSNTWFSCCAGTGRQFTTDGVAVCPLAKRVAQLQAVLDSYRQKWGVGNKHFLHAVLDRVDMQKLAAIAAGSSTGGRILTSPADDQPGPLWTLAVAAAWRFARQVHFVTLRSGSKDCLLPSQQLPRPVLLVESYFPPWQPEARLDCEVLIDYCYNTMTPLWLDFVQTKRSVTLPASNAILANLRQRIVQRQQDKPLSYFSNSSLMKLRAMQMV